METASRYVCERMYATAAVVDTHAHVLILQCLQLVLLLASVIATSVLETCTAQIDNLVLPLFFFATCNLVACHRTTS